MSGSDLRAAWKALRANSPTLEYEITRPSNWWRCLGELLWSEKTPTDDVISNLKDSPVAAPGTCATAPMAAIMDALRDIPRGPQKALVLNRVAQWWMTEFGDEVSPEWTADREHYREGLRAIRGIGPEVADRLLLIAGDLTVFPIDRATLRIAVRHGWLDFPVDDEQAQSTFLSVFERDASTMQQASRILKTIGARYCGRVPDCSACPLMNFLPDGGPLHVDDC